VTEKIKNEEKPEALKLGGGSSKSEQKKSEESESDDRDYSKLELEHVELLGRLQKTESELDKLRQQTNEKKDDDVVTLKVSDEMR